MRYNNYIANYYNMVRNLIFENYICNSTNNVCKFIVSVLR